LKNFWSLAATNPVRNNNKINLAAKGDIYVQGNTHDGQLGVGFFEENVAV
jgi:hypothetical protein